VDFPPKKIVLKDTESLTNFDEALLTKKYPKIAIICAFENSSTISNKTWEKSCKNQPQIQLVRFI